MFFPAFYVKGDSKLIPFHWVGQLSKERKTVISLMNIQFCKFQWIKSEYLTAERFVTG